MLVLSQLMNYQRSKVSVKELLKKNRKNLTVGKCKK